MDPPDMVPTAESEDAAENSGILADGEKGGGGFRRVERGGRVEKWTSFLLFAALMWGVQGSGRKVRAQTRTRHRGIWARPAGRGEASMSFPLCFHYCFHFVSTLFPLLFPLCLHFGFQFVP